MNLLKYRNIEIKSILRAVNQIFDQALPNKELLSSSIQLLKMLFYFEHLSITIQQMLKFFLKKTRKAIIKEHLFLIQLC